MRMSWRFGAILLLLLFVAPRAGTAERAPAPLRIGVAESPPLAIRQSDGTWSGLAVDLWTHIAADLNLQYELQPIPLDAAAPMLRDGALDAVLGAIPVSPEGEEQFDYSQPYLATGLGFAQRMDDQLRWGALWDTLLSTRLLSIIGAIMVAVLLVGIIIAWVERRHHSTDFGGPWQQGVSTGVWWAAVTMTTVGYGDATPKTGPGRALALLWMFVGVIAVAILTATATSILTLSHMQGTVSRPTDLLRLRLGAVPGAAGADYLTDRHTPFEAFADYEAGLNALHENRIDAFVANIPALRYLIHLSWHGELEVSPIALEAVLYAIALPTSSPLRGRIDSALLRATHEDIWREVERHYLGPDHRL